MQKLNQKQELPKIYNKAEEQKILEEKGKEKIKKAEVHMQPVHVLAGDWDCVIVTTDKNTKLLFEYDEISKSDLDHMGVLMRELKGPSDISKYKKKVGGDIKGKFYHSLVNFLKWLRILVKKDVPNFNPEINSRGPVEYVTKILNNDEKELEKIAKGI